MMTETVKSRGPGLLRVVAPVSGEDVVVNRPHRRAITGVAFHAQKCRLVLDIPDAAGNESFPCRIADVSDAGLGVVCRAAEQAPNLFQAGAQMTLEAGDGKRSRVEVRWASNGRLGLKRFADKPR